MSADIIIKTLDEGYDEHNDELDRLRREFLDSKTFCCCIPGGTESENDSAKDFKKCPELKKVCGLAISKDTKKLVGFCQMLFEGMPNMFHKSKPGEAYVQMLAVDDYARGKGIGSKLMLWAEQLSRERNCSYMTLDVLHGNPAIGLYERQGYAIQEKALWKKILCAIPWMCLLGPVICTSNSPRYCSYGQTYFMKKLL